MVKFSLCTPLSHGGSGLVAPPILKPRHQIDVSVQFHDLAVFPQGKEVPNRYGAGCAPHSVWALWEWIWRVNKKKKKFAV